MFCIFSQKYNRLIYLCNQLQKVYRLQKVYQMKKHTREDCLKTRRAVQDTLETISGKWKLLILHALNIETLRFKKLCQEIDITPRMLSKELKDLEMNKLIQRIVYDTKPVTVEYSITDYGKTLGKVILEMKNWGLTHRKKIMQTN